MIPQFNADSLAFTSALRDFQRLSGRSLREVMRDERRLGMQTLQRFTPPRNFRKEGEPRVHADISKAVRGLNIRSFKNERLKEIVANRDIAAIENFFERSKNPVFKGGRVVQWSSDLHERQRDSRGRVRRRRPSRNWVIGADADALRAHREKKVGNVGIARAGWSAAVLAAGGRAPAKWIRRHGERFGGYRILNANTDKETFEAINRTPWASRKDEGERQVNRMLGQRARSIEKKTDILRQAGRRAGFEVR